MNIHVRRFPVLPDGNVWQVSNGGGTHPLWSRSGDELFYLAADGAMMSVRVSVNADRWTPVTPTRLFHGRYLTHTSENSRHYDVSGDSKRFVMIKQDNPDRPRPIVIVQGWAEELKRKVQ